LSELETLREHAREMAEKGEPPRPGLAKWCRRVEVPVWHPDHERGIEPRHDWCVPMGGNAAWKRCGCPCHDHERPMLPTDAERKLWRQIAEEVGAYLDRPDEGQETLL